MSSEGVTFAGIETLNALFANAGGASIRAHAALGISAWASFSRRSVFTG